MYNELYVRYLATWVKRFILIKSYIILLCLTAAQLYMTGINIKAFHHLLVVTPTMSPPSLMTTHAIMYFTLMTASHVYMTVIGFTYAINYRYLHREPRKQLKWVNIFVGFVMILASVFAWTVDRTNNSLVVIFPIELSNTVTVNTVFLYFVIVTGCIKRGFDYNMRLLHRPTWAAGSTSFN